MAAHIAFSYLMVIIIYNEQGNLSYNTGHGCFQKENVDFTLLSYPYGNRGGTKTAVGKLKVDERCMIKTLVMEDEARKPLMALMHGDKEGSTKSLARAIGMKFLAPCKPDRAGKHTGVRAEGTVSFGTRKLPPVYMAPPWLICRRWPSAHAGATFPHACRRRNSSACSNR